MVAISLYILALFVPGFFVTQLLQKSNPCSLLIRSIAYSLSIITFLVGLCLLLDLPPKYFYIALIVITGTLSILHLLFCDKLLPQIGKHSLISSAIIVIGVLIYHMIVGVYFELPADVYIHLEFFEFSNDWITLQNDLHHVDLKDTFSKSTQYWYYAISLFAHLDQASLFDLIPYFMIANITLFLLAINSLCLYVFQHFFSSKNLLFACALLATFFTFMHYGINVFSFVRYYAIAPVILTIIIYFAAVINLIDYLQNKNSTRLFIFAGTVFFIFSAMLHRQEALFIATAYLLIPFCALYSQSFSIKSTLCANSSIPKYNNKRAIWLSGLAFIGFFVIYILVVNTGTANSAVYPKLISLQKIWHGGKDFFALNPKFQFYTVLTHWGFWLYALYALYYRHFNRNIYIRALMLMPLVTVFNPLFVHLFLHVSSSDVLWRFLYMLPIYFVAAYLVIIAVTNLRQSSRPMQIAHILLIVPLFVFLLPLNFSINGKNINLDYSRIDTLKPVNSKNSYQNWQDVIDFLQQLPEKKNVITDPVTGYIIDPITQHENHRYKFLSGYMRDKYLFDDYSDFPLNRYKGSLLIINLREGALSENGRTSRHWPENVLKTKQYYNEALLKHIRQNPDIFNTIFRRNNVSIYYIK